MPDWNQILIEISCDNEIILMKWHFRKRLCRIVIISPHWWKTIHMDIISYARQYIFNFAFLS